MDGKGVSVLLGGLYSKLLCFLDLLISVLLYDKLCRTICWDLMAGCDGCVNEGRHVFKASKLLAQVGRQPGSLNWYIFSKCKIKSTQST
jgi:hypothetical protein